MYKTKILIISKRKELSIKYKKLIESLNQDVIYTNDLSESLSIIQNEKIEFIVISDTIKEKLSDFIRKIRILTYNYHPIIIAVSKSSELEDKLQALDSGADDFLGEEISKQEFQMRFRAHLRRYIESSLNSVTHLLNKDVTIKQLERSLKTNENLSYILIRIKNIEQYRLNYGEIACEKVLQTLGAIIKSTLSNDDFVGHIFDNELILITNTFNTEKLCAFLVFAFDNILNKFYSTDEFNDNFIIQSNDSVQEEKNSLMKLNITAIEKNQNEKDFRNIINNLNELMKLCEKSEKSTYIVDRAKLQGETSKVEVKNKVLILEFDESLGYLLKNVCELNNLVAKTANNYSDFLNIYEEFKPNVVVLDWGKDSQTKSLEYAKKIKNDNIKLIFSSSFLNKKEILKAGADLYLPKPYEIDDVLNWIKKFLED